MRLLLVADTFPPICSSGAVQLRDLSREFVLQGHSLCVLLPAVNQNEPWRLEEFDGIQVLRLRAPKTKNIGYVRRTLAELVMPFAMLLNLRKSPMARERWDGVVWYSPSIFHGPLIKRIKLANNCKSYLIIRDIFPQWAADMGLMRKRGFIFLFFNAVATYQYSVADIIGVQTTGNLDYFKDWTARYDRRLEVLQNWLFDSPYVKCSISLSNTKLAGRKILVYAGNMGVAQGVDIFLDLAELLQARSDIGFLFVGRGVNAEKLSENARLRKLDNVLFYDEIHPDEIPGLYTQCAVGLVALDPRHRSHNIPGKFLTYMQAGLPVLARINSGNDLVGIITKNNIGRVSLDNDKNSLEALAYELLNLLETDHNIKDRCRNLYLELYSPMVAVKQIVCALEDKSVAT